MLDHNSLVFSTRESRFIADTLNDSKPPVANDEIMDNHSHGGLSLRTIRGIF